MPALSLRWPSRRFLIGAAVLAITCGLSLWGKPSIDRQNAAADRWASSAVTALEYNATAHLRLVAATSPWASAVTTKSEKDLIALAVRVAETTPPGSAADDASRCWEDAGDMWWGDAQSRAEKACQVLDDRLVEYARLDVLTAYAAAIEQVCGQSVTDAYPMAEHYPFTDATVADSLTSIDRRLAKAPKDCTPTVTIGNDEEAARP